MKSSKFIVLSALAAATAAHADIMDRPQGIKIGDRMTLRPYVGLSFTYDSNMDSSKHSKRNSSWNVSPGFTLEYADDNWSVTGDGYYQYHAYNDYNHQLNSSSYGETLTVKWSNSEANAKGWSLLVSETFRQISQDDDMSNSKGRGIGRDRCEFNANGALERRLNAYWRAAVLGNYYLLDYDNNSDKYAALYGWTRAVAGGEIAFAPSPWTDIILHANYQWYSQDNDKDRYNGGGNDRGVSSESKGWSVMAGLGTRATEKLKYRALAGWSRFEYGDGVKTSNGFTYQLSGEWKISDTFSAMALGSSYYQPSEREYASSIKVHTASVGVGKSFVRGKLRGTLDFSFRNEQHETSTEDAGKYDENIWTARAGVNYTFNRFTSLFGTVEYQTSETSGGHVSGHYYDYDRVRCTVGVRLTY